MCTTVPTIQVHGSYGNEVRAPITEGSGEFHLGHHRLIRITNIGPDEETPLRIREVLIGLTICTIFSGQLFSQPPDARLAYATEVSHALQEAGNALEAEILMTLCGTFGFYVFEPGTFEFV